MCWRGVCTHSHTRVQAWPPAQYLQLVVQMLTMQAHASTRVRAAFWVHRVLLHVAVSMSEQCTRACPHRGTIPSPPCRHHSPTPSLTTPSSAGALSPTTSITGQLEVRGKGTVRAGAGLCHPASPVLCQSDSYRRVLALGTVPGRLMSRSLRLAEKKERASVSP